MKKTITLLALAFTVASAKAQSYVADFESLPLGTSASYSNITSTPFETNNASFQFTWDTTYHNWEGGFSYTNIHDSITAGYSNQFGVRAYKGFNNSEKYVVGKDGGLIKMKTGYNVVDGFYITNTTYDWKSMKTGDQFAKKFGGSTGNDADYFGVTAKGYFNGHLKSDTVNFYLADFRFANNTQDYIVNDWQFFNTSLLGLVDSIQFFMFSSDTGAYGINTPTYFALDNFSTSHILPDGIAKNSSNLSVSVYPNPFSSSLMISMNEATPSTKAVVTDITGKVVHSETLSQTTAVLNLDALQNGIYFLELSSGNQKSVKKLIKN